MSLIVMPSDPIQAIVDAFDRVNLVALGERHRALEDAQFRLRLIRGPGFAQTVDDIVIEFANPLHQALLSRFVDGADVPAVALRTIWQDTSQPGAWDSPVYEDFLGAVRAANLELPAGRRLRVLAGDCPIDWGAVSGPTDLPDPGERDRFAADVIRREVLARGRRALVIFGAAHIYRGRPGTLTDLLQHDSRAKWFVAVPAGGPGLPAPLASIPAAPGAPALIGLNGGLGDLAAADVLERGTRRLKLLAEGKPALEDGKPVFMPVFERGVTVRQLADALLFFGCSPVESVPPPPGLYDGEYGREVLRRREIQAARCGITL